MSDSPIRRELDEITKEATDGDVTDEISQLVGGFSKEHKGSGDELKLYDNWMPGPEQYQGKTNIEPHQAHALAGVRQLAHVYEMLGIEIEGLEEFLIALVKDYELYKTSVNGLSREEQVRVLMAKAGVHAEMEEAGRGLLARAASALPEENGE